MKLSGKKAIILTEDEDMYNEFEVWYPYSRLIEEGCKVTIVGPGHSTTFHSKYGIPAVAEKSASSSNFSERRRLFGG